MNVQHHLSHPKYRPDIDGIRAIAVLAVVWFHAFPDSLPGGFIGVDIFFVLSGYLISTILFENLAKGTFSFSEFYVRRILRIFPALLIVLIACYMFGWFTLLADEYRQLGKHIAGGATFVSNFVLWNEASYFDNSAESKPLLHLWSLGVEEQFYLIWPLLLWFSYKKRINLLAISIAVASISFYFNISGIEKNSVATFYSPQTRFWELMFGTILAWLTLNSRLPFFSLASRRLDTAPDKTTAKTTSYKHLLINLISVSGLLILVLGFLKINKNLLFPGVWALIPTIGTVLIIFSGPNAWVNRHILSHKIAVGVGLISYPLYLWHWPLLSFAHIIENGTPNIGIRKIIVVASLVLAWVTYKVIEKPIRFGDFGKEAKVTTLDINGYHRNSWL